MIAADGTSSNDPSSQRRHATSGCRSRSSRIAEPALAEALRLEPVPETDEAQQRRHLGEVGRLPFEPASPLPQHHQHAEDPGRGRPDRDQGVHVRRAALRRLERRAIEAAPHDREHERAGDRKRGIEPRRMPQRVAGPVQRLHRNPAGDGDRRAALPGAPPSNVLPFEAASELLRGLLDDVGPRFESGGVDAVGQLPRVEPPPADDRSSRREVDRGGRHALDRLEGPPDGRGAARAGHALDTERQHFGARRSAWLDRSVHGVTGGRGHGSGFKQPGEVEGFRDSVLAAARHARQPIPPPRYAAESSRSPPKRWVGDR